MVTHSSILAWKISCTEETGRLQVTSMGVTKSRTQLCMCVHARARTHIHTHTHTHTHTHEASPSNSYRVSDSSWLVLEID